MGPAHRHPACSAAPPATQSLAAAQPPPRSPACNVRGGGIGGCPHCGAQPAQDTQRAQRAGKNSACAGCTRIALLRPESDLVPRQRLRRGPTRPPPAANPTGYQPHATYTASWNPASVPPWNAITHLARVVGLQVASHHVDYRAPTGAYLLAHHQGGGVARLPADAHPLLPVGPLLNHHLHQPGERGQRARM